MLLEVQGLLLEDAEWPLHLFNQSPARILIDILKLEEYFNQEKVGQVTEGIFYGFLIEAIAGQVRPREVLQVKLIELVGVIEELQGFLQQ